MHYFYAYNAKKKLCLRKKLSSIYTYIHTSIYTYNKTVEKLFLYIKKKLKKFSQGIKGQPIEPISSIFRIFVCLSVYLFVCVFVQVSRKMYEINVDNFYTQRLSVTWRGI